MPALTTDPPESLSFHCLLLRPTHKQFKAAIEQGVRTLVFGLGVYQLLLLAFTLYKAHLA